MKDGFRIMDCDIHVLEPMELWVEYLEPEFRDRAPTAPQRLSRVIATTSR